MNVFNKKADIVFHNAYLYTADSQDSVLEAIAIKDGYILAVGSNTEIQTHIGEGTQSIDLKGKMMMPGLVDGHLHAIWAGTQLLSASLSYQCLTVAQILEIIQEQLDKDRVTGENDYLQVRAWLRSGMIPVGADITRADLDTLNTKRPVILFANDCHTLVANSRALKLLELDENTPQPSDGKYYKNADGTLNGIMDDAPAMRAFDKISAPIGEQAVRVAEATQNALNAQGVTTVMDARVYPEHLDAFATLKKQGKLHLRFVGAKEVTPTDAKSPADAERVITNIAQIAKRYNSEWTPSPDVGLYNVKFFIDGVLQPPMMTGSLREPYLENKGTEQAPNWQPSERYGDLYFDTDILNALFVACGKEALNPHTHTMTDGAIEVVLNAITEMRNAYPNKDIRPTLAHNEVVGNDQYPRYAKLNATALVALQWSGVTKELMEEERNILGEERFKNLETAGRFIDSGVRLAFGSDWPIDALNEWYAFQVGITRKAYLGDGKYSPRMDTDRNLTLQEALRAGTINSAYVIQKEQYVGSLEKGKFADLIVLDQNVFKIAPEEVKNTQVLLTMIGGKAVYNPSGIV